MIVGIDLGTTNSLVAYFSEEGPKIIPNRLGENLTPSVVSIDEQGLVYVGETAKERMLLYPDSSASVFKRSMGTLQKYKLNDKEFTSEELSSFVLRALKEDAEHHLGLEVTEAVISVPAYFNDARRKATKRAGELAGFKVERIISEPTAAAISYGLYHRNESTKFLVFDLGGGTFDISILELFHNILEVRAVAGDNFLGGEDFTHILENMFYEKNTIDRNQVDSKTLNHIHKQAELCKMNFSIQKTNSMNCNIKGIDIHFEIKDTAYEVACEELLERIKQPIKRSLADAKVKLDDIDMVILVGGATKLPLIQKFVSKMFKKFPNTSINPDEAVALGAAIQAAMKERNEAIKEVILTDVCPFTLGTEVVAEKWGNRLEGGHFFPIIERNTIIPASRTQRLYTAYDNQTKIKVNVLQGESRFATNNLSLGELFIEVPKGKAGDEAVEITYTYDINAILEVEVISISTGEKKKQIIKGQNTDMTQEEIEERMKELSYLKIPPRQQEENKLLLLRAERLYEEIVGLDRQELEKHIIKFEQGLDTQDNRIIEKERNVFKQYLNRLMNH